MKVAVIGSRNPMIENMDNYLPEGTDEIVSGGALGIDACAARWAREHGITLTEFLPQYEKYGRAFPFCDPTAKKPHSVGLFHYFKKKRISFS